MLRVNGSGTIEIDLNKAPGRDGVELKGRNYSYALGGVEVTISLASEKTELTICKKLTYDLPAGNKLKAIKHKTELEGEFEGKLKDNSRVTVWYWIGDGSYGTPLLIQIGNNSNDRYVYSTQDKKWKTDNLAPSNIKKALDREKCLRLKAHQFELSQDSGSTTCSTMSCKQSFTIAPLNSEYSNDYKGYKFTPEGNSQDTTLFFTYNATFQEEMSYPKGLQFVNVFWKTTPKTPISFTIILKG